MGDDKWYTALQLAVLSDNLDIAVCLINAGADINTRPVSQTPLAFAIDANCPRILQMLIDRGVNVDEKPQGNGPWWNVPLMRAVVTNKNDDDGCVRVLLNAGADPRVMDQRFSTPLGVSTAFGRKNLIQSFLDFGVDVDDPIDERGSTSLMWSVEIENDEVTKLLLAAGADPSTADWWGVTALSYAAKAGRLGTVKTLLPFTTNLNIQSLESKTALYEAADQGHQAIVEALLGAGAEIQPQEPGPHCLFMDPSERIGGFAWSALVGALFSGHDAISRTMLKFFAERQTQAMEQETYRNVLRSLDADGWDSFDAEEFRKTGAAWVIKCNSRGVSEEVVYESMLATAENPFCRFAMWLTLMNCTNYLHFRNFTSEHVERGWTIIRHRKERIAERLEGLHISEQKEKEQ